MGRRAVSGFGDAGDALALYAPARPRGSGDLIDLGNLDAAWAALTAAGVDDTATAVGVLAAWAASGRRFADLPAAIKLRRP